MSSTPPELTRSPITDVGPAVREAESLRPPRSIVTIPFAEEGVPASQTDKVMLRTVEISAFSTVPPVLPYRGSVAAMGLTSTGNKTAGTASFTVFKNAASLGATVVWPNGVAKAIAKFAPGTYPFAELDAIDVRFTTDGSFAPSAALSVILDLYLLIDPIPIL